MLLFFFRQSVELKRCGLHDMVSCAVLLPLQMLFSVFQMWTIRIARNCAETYFEECRADQHWTATFFVPFETASFASEKRLPGQSSNATQQHLNPPLPLLQCMRFQMVGQIHNENNTTKRKNEKEGKKQKTKRNKQT